MSNYTFSSALEEITEINPSFDKARLRICYTGVNRNKSSISKEVIEKAIPTIYGCPVVANYSIENDEIGGHDIEIVERNNDYIMVNATNPVGFIPQGAAFGWEEVDDHEYLWAECIIWKRSAAYSNIVNRGITNQSMEIEINSHHTDNEGVYVIDGFYFTAFCLLGEDTEPCFADASLQFSLNDAKKQINDMIKEYAITLAPVSIEQELDNNNSAGKEEHEMENEVVTEGVQEEVAPTPEETVEPISEQPAEIPAEETPASEAPVEPEAPADNFELASEIERPLRMAVEAETITDTDGWSYSRRWFVDYDPQCGEVYYRDSVTGGLYGAQYLIGNDGGYIIEYATEKAKRIAYVDAACPSGESNPGMNTMAPNPFLESSYELKNKFEATNKDLDELKVSHDQLQALYDELSAYRSQKEAAERAIAVNAVFDNFADLAGNETFEALKAYNASLSVEEIEDKCYAIRGRMATIITNAQAFSLKEDQVRLVIEKNQTNIEKEPYGGLFIKYANRI